MTAATTTGDADTRSDRATAAGNARSGRATGAVDALSIGGETAQSTLR
ncbi:MAG: hypothetical protein F2789_07710 [Actinobacteria bacterium]|nr:hypothetical protein [Actinomycetota bacterium]